MFWLQLVYVIMGGVNQIEDIGPYELISGIPTILLYIVVPSYFFTISVSMPSAGHCYY